MEVGRERSGRESKVDREVVRLAVSVVFISWCLL